MTADSLYARLLAGSPDSAPRALAARYAPIILFDRREPFLPLVAGYTVFDADARSPSLCRAPSRMCSIYSSVSNSPCHRRRISALVANSSSSFPTAATRPSLSTMI